MSEHIIKKANGHKVKHLFSGKNHFFEVETKAGEKHNVAMQLGCDCRYMGVQGKANGEICSHILAVINKISKDGRIKKARMEVKNE